MQSLHHQGPLTHIWLLIYEIVRVPPLQNEFKHYMEGWAYSEDFLGHGGLC